MSIYTTRQHSGRPVCDLAAYAADVLQRERKRLQALLTRRPDAPERRLLPLLESNLTRFTAARNRQAGRARG